jgi:5S rRNA maturation endonuclease (ribonuclease M5)
MYRPIRLTMKPPITFILICFLFFSLISRAQEDLNEQAKPIVAEGKLLYRSEMASWYGTDIFLEKYPNRQNLGGYVSYPFGTLTRCVFFSRADAPKVIGTVAFDSTFDVKTAVVDLTEREMNEIEKEYYALRKAAIQVVNNDTLFKSYNNTNLNLIPVLDGGQKRVYILTGPVKNGVVIFGNDYLLTFDQQNNVLTKKALHKNIIVTSLEDFDAKGQTMVAGMHNHLPETGAFISPTDICTLMLYSKSAGWEHYYVTSEKVYNIWNCKTNQLLVLTREAYERIQADGKNKN